MERKVCNQYFLSVDGDTEKWYFEHLQKIINKDETLQCKIKLHLKVCPSPKKRARTITAPYKVTCFHICDYESNEDEHKQHFKEVLKELKEIKKINKNLRYELGYSNYAFELWMILHKEQQLASLSHRKNYLSIINKVYKQHFESLKTYKEEENFKEILKDIELKDVIQAIKNAEEIRTKNEKNSKKKITDGKIIYYEDNPDLTIHKCIKQILVECGAMPKE